MNFLSLILISCCCIGFCLSHDALFDYGGSNTRTASVFISTDNARKMIIKERDFKAQGFSENELVQGSFTDSINTTGWALLELHTNPAYADQATAQAAGYLEGYLTAFRILQNAKNNDVLSPIPTSLTQFLDANEQFLAQKIQNASSLPDSDPEKVYWHHIALILQQLTGLTAGYNDSPTGNQTALTFRQMVLLNLGGDMEDLSDLITKKTPIQKAQEAGHCSALLRLLDNNADVYVSQDTWSSLNSMLRIFKLYDFPWLTLDTRNELVPGIKTSFSSYPGSLFSGDDFYVLSSGLIVQETTIGYSNPDIKKFIQPTTVLEWMRNYLANRLAADALSWTQIYAKYNSGTYNNQNMIFDMNKFKPGQPLVNGTFYLCEQIPGSVVSNDLSQLLQTQRYFGSYNSAYDPVIRQVSGADDLVKQYGSWFSYDQSPRAQIFRRDHGNVDSLDSMKKIMRYCDYTHDPLSSQLPQCDFLKMTNCTPSYTAENVIACRDDLNPKNGVYAFDALGWRNHVATDSKITSFSMFNNNTVPCVAISGPTYDQVPPFQFSTSQFNDVPHEGLPDLWQFPWVTVAWE